MTPYDQKTLSHRFSSFLIDRPILSICIGLLLAAALIPGIRKMQTDFSYRIWFRETDPLLARFDAFERQFGNDEMLAIAIDSPSGIFDVESATLLQNLTEDMWRVAEVIRVDSLSNYNWTHASGDDLIVEPLIPDERALTEAVLAQRKTIALGHEIIPGYLVSKDGTATVIYAQLKPAINGTPDFETVVRETRAVIAKYEGQGDHQFYLTGPAAVSNTFKEVTQADLRVMVPILMGAIVLFLLITLRGVAGVLLPFTVIGFSLAMTLGASGWMGIRFNNLTAVVPHILIAISVADAVHILVSFFQFRRAGLERKPAAHKTLVKNLQPTLLTSLSTAIGFYSFSTAKIIPIVYMGVLAGTGTLIAWMVTIFIVTPLLAYLPIRIPAGGFKTKVRHDQPHPMALRYAAWLGRWRWTMIIAFLVSTIGAIYLASRNEINSNPFKYFAKNVPTRIANEFAEQKIGGMLGIEIVIDSGKTDGIKEPAFLKRIDDFQDWLNGRDHVSKTVAITDIIKQINRSLNGDDPRAYIIPDDQNLIAQELFLYSMSLPRGMDLNNRMTLDYSKIRLTTMSNLHDSRASLREMEIMEEKAAAMGLDAHITGKMPLYHNMNPYVVSAFLTSISMALVLVALLMMYAMKSVKLGLLSMIPNTVPLIFGGALMTLLHKPLDIGTVLVASTCLGIAVDDTIHFLSNYNRWRKLGVSTEEAVAQVITHTGPALLVTTMVLVAAFATFAFASFVPNINFGILTAIVLTTALLADFTLLPAILLQPETARETARHPIAEPAT